MEDMLLLVGGGGGGCQLVCVCVCGWDETVEVRRTRTVANRRGEEPCRI